MSRLYVGCRVRIVGGPFTRGGAKKFVGRTGTVIGRCTCPDPDCNRWNVDSAMNEFGGLIAWLPESLEPILPDGHQACDEDFKRDLDKLLERQGVVA